MNDIVITNNNGSLTVSSVQVAENFGKQHKDVLKAIENIRAQNCAVTSAQNFADLFMESSYADSYGRMQKSFECTRDGFTLLAMGFTGKAALAIGMPEPTFRGKLTIKDRSFTFEEAARIKVNLFPELDIFYLFKRDED